MIFANKHSASSLFSICTFRIFDFQRGESVFMVACSLGLNELIKRMAEDSEARDLMRKDIKIQRKVCRAA
jgi:hypothetical protein